MDITIVGAGVMGLATAWWATRQGHRVTVLEQGEIPHPHGSSHDLHRLIRHAYGAEEGYTRLVDRAFADWQHLWSDLGRSHYRPTGILGFRARDRAAEGGWLRDSAAVLERVGVPFTRYQGAALAGLRRRYDYLQLEDIDEAMELELGGVLLAQRIVEDLAAWLGRAGATLRSGSEVVAVEPGAAAVRLADGGRVTADRLLLTTGSWTPGLLPQVVGRVTPSRQTVAYIEPPAELEAAWAEGPMLLDLSARSPLYTVPAVIEGDPRFKVGDHAFSLRGDPRTDDRTPREGEGAALLSLLAARVRQPERYRLSETRVCFYAVQPQERFVVEPIAGVPVGAGPRSWLATGFSGHGFKFGATVGRELAGLLTGQREALAVQRLLGGRGAGAAGPGRPPGPG